MFKRLTAVLLVLVLALSACGKGKRDERYVSDRPMDVFAAIEAVRDLRDCTFELQVSQMDDESGELGALQYTLSGVWYASIKQARAELRLADGTLLTTLSIDGSDLYADLGTAASVLETKYRELEEEEYAAEMENAARDLKEGVVRIPLGEDPWTAWESGRLSQSREKLKELYQRVKRLNSRRVKMEDHVGRLSLGLGDLQNTLLEITGDLLENREVYQGELTKVLTEDFGLLLDHSDRDAGTRLEERWTEYELTREEIEELQSTGDFNGWTVKLLACGDESSGYSLDLTMNFSEAKNYCLSACPAQASELEMPGAYVQVQDAAQYAMQVYEDASLYLEQYQDGDVVGKMEELTDEELEDFFDASAAESVETVTTAPVEGSSTLITTSITTSDGMQRTVPLLAHYDALKAEGSTNVAADVYQSSSGYVLEYVSTDERDLAKAARDNAEMYATEFKENWGFDIITEASQSVVSADGDVAAAGMAYHDSDLDQDVTAITCCLGVKNSSEMIYLDLFVYSKSVTDKELQAMEDLMHYLGVELPVEIIKN